MDRALRSVPSLPAKPITVPPELERYESQNDGYKSAMLMDTPKRYPERCRISMLRLKADLLFAMGNTQELEKIFSALSGGNYENIDKIKRELKKEKR